MNILSFMMKNLLFDQNCESRLFLSYQQNKQSEFITFMKKINIFPAFFLFSTKMWRKQTDFFTDICSNFNEEKKQSEGGRKL